MSDHNLANEQTAVDAVIEAASVGRASPAAFIETLRMLTLTKKWRALPALHSIIGIARRFYRNGPDVDVHKKTAGVARPTFYNRRLAHSLLYRFKKFFIIKSINHQPKATHAGLSA